MTKPNANLDRMVEEGLALLHTVYRGAGQAPPKVDVARLRKVIGDKLGKEQVVDNAQLAELVKQVEAEYGRELTANERGIVEEELVRNNCGTGAGGFKKGNTCAKGGKGKSSLPSQKGEQAAKELGVKLSRSLLHRTTELAKQRSSTVWATAAGRARDAVSYAEEGNLREAASQHSAAGWMIAQANGRDPLPTDQTSQIVDAMHAHDRAYEFYLAAVKGATPDELSLLAARIEDPEDKVTQAALRDYYEETGLDPDIRNRESKSRLPGPKEDEEGLRKALAQKPTDKLTRLALADLLEEQGNDGEADKQRAIAKHIEDYAVAARDERINKRLAREAYEAGDEEEGRRLDAATREAIKRRSAALHGIDKHMDVVDDNAETTKIVNQVIEASFKEQLPSQHDEHALKQAMLSDPTDEVSRLAYADYLEEQGKSEAAAEHRELGERIRQFKGLMEQYLHFAAAEELAYDRVTQLRSTPNSESQRQQVYNEWQRLRTRRNNRARVVSREESQIRDMFDTSAEADLFTQKLDEYERREIDRRLEATHNAEGDKTNCGTGAGGFQPGNTCAKSKGGSNSRPGPKEDEAALRKALDNNVYDKDTRLILADFYEEQGEQDKADKERRVADLIDRIVPLQERVAQVDAETPSELWDYVDEFYDVDHPYVNELERYREAWTPWVTVSRELEKLSPRDWVKVRWPDNVNTQRRYLLHTYGIVDNADCGTGAGGFKPGNTCAKGKGSGGGLSKPKGKTGNDELTLRKAVANDPLNVLNRRSLANHLAENGKKGEANRIRDVADRLQSLNTLMDGYLDATIKEQRAHERLRALGEDADPKELVKATRVWGAAAANRRRVAARVQAEEDRLKELNPAEHAAISKALDELERKELDDRLGNNNTKLPSPKEPTVAQASREASKALTRAVRAGDRANRNNDHYFFGIEDYPEVGLLDPRVYGRIAQQHVNRVKDSPDPYDTLEAADSLDTAADAHRGAANYHQSMLALLASNDNALHDAEYLAVGEPYHTEQHQNHTNAAGEYARAAMHYRELAISKARTSKKDDTEFQLRLALSENPDDQLAKAALADYYEEHSNQKQANRYRSGLTKNVSTDTGWQPVASSAHQWEAVA